MDPLWATAVKALVLSLVLLGAFAYMTLVERRLLGRMQHRLGPNRVGPFGLFQPVADGIKMLIKEDIVPQKADKVVHFLAPIAMIAPAMAALAALVAATYDPWSSS